MDSRTVKLMKALEAGVPMVNSGTERRLRAYVRTSSRSVRPRVIAYLQGIGTFEVAVEAEGFIFTGERTPVILALTELRYKFPVAFGSGWTLP